VFLRCKLGVIDRKNGGFDRKMGVLGCFRVF
jgi:hypothetical protein